jgi:hypothetical protein
MRKIINIRVLDFIDLSNVEKNFMTFSHIAGLYRMIGLPLLLRYTRGHYNINFRIPSNYPKYTCGNPQSFPLSLDVLCGYLWEPCNCDHKLSVLGIIGSPTECFENRKLLFCLIFCLNFRSPIDKIICWLYS